MNTTPAALAARIKALKAEATPGPWETRFMHRVFDSARKDPINLFGSEPKQDWRDCELFVELVNNLDRITLALEALDVLDELTEAADHDMQMNQGTDDDAGGWWSLRTANAIAKSRAALTSIKAAKAGTV